MLGKDIMDLRVCLGASLIALAAGCSGSSNPLVGAWKCESDVAGGTMSVESTYMADGKTRGSGDVKVSDGGMSIDMKLTYTGTWKQEGDKLTEQMTDVKIERATVNGQPLPPEAADAMTAGMKMPQTTTVKIEGNTLTQSDGGATVTCKK
jgi:hypothetical protein